MKIHKTYFIIIIILLTVCLINQYSTIENLSKENKEISYQSKELKKYIDRMNKNIVSLKQELERDASFNSFIHFNPDNITEPSEVNYIQLHYALKDTKLSSYINSFLLAEKHYNINALFIIGVVANESAWLTSNRALKQNNVTGYAVYSDDSVGASFPSIDDCILKTAELISKDYIDPQGKYYNGLSVSDINTMYSSDDTWDDTVTDVGNQLKDRVNEMVKLFCS